MLTIGASVAVGRLDTDSPLPPQAASVNKRAGNKQRSVFTALLAISE
jgi:hypothetical protein